MLVVVLEGKTSFIMKAFSSLKYGAINDIACSSCLLMSTKICSIPILPHITLVSAYWSNALSKPSLVSSSLSQVAFFTANVKATYLAFINDRGTVAYLLAYQLTKPLFSIKIKLKVDFHMA